jgi:tetratricopeptide (TPR) repeat protein
LGDRLKRGLLGLQGLIVAALPSGSSRIVCGLLGCLALACCFVPGFDVLNYYSGLAISIAGGLGVGFAVALGPQPTPGDTLKRLLWKRLVTALTICLIPLGVLLLNATRVINCDPGTGLAFYAVGPGATMLLAAVWGLAALLLGRSRKRSALFFLAVWILWIGADIAAFLTEPPIFAYNAFVGFFSGAVYDDLIRIAPPFFYFRLGNLAQVGLLLALLAAVYAVPRGRVELARLRSVTVGGWALIAVLALTVAGFSGASGYLGYQVDRETIQARLGGSISNDKIDLYYDSKTIKPQEAARILEDQSFRLHQLEVQFGDTYPEKISAYVYGSREEKRALMGAERTSIAKPWLNEVHLHRSPYGRGVVHHELAHVYFSQYTDSLLGVPAEAILFPKMMLVEGAAMAVEFYGGDLTQHEWSAALQREGLAPRLDNLLSPASFWNVNPGRGYILAGSFIRWLLETHGVERFKVLYRDGDFEEAYDDSLSHLLEGWRTFLKEQVLPDDAQDRARTRFGSPGVLKRVCPLVIPRMEADARTAMVEGRWTDALKIQRSIVDFMPEAPIKRLSILSSLVRLEALEEAEKVRLEISSMSNATEVMRSRADEIVADGFWRGGERQEALRTYARLLERPLSENRRRSIWAKVLVAGDDDLEPIFGPYLLHPMSEDVLDYLTEAIIDLPDHRLALYLAGRRFTLERHYKTGTTLLEKTLAAPALRVPVANALVEIEATRLLGSVYIHLRRYEDARHAYTQVLNRSTTQASRNTAKDWLERINWLVTEREKGKN